MKTTKQLLAKFISGLAAIILGGLIYSMVAPSLMPNSVAIEQGMQPSLMDPKIIWACVVLTPVLFCIQPKIDGYAVHFYSISIFLYQFYFLQILNPMVLEH